MLKSEITPSIMLSFIYFLQQEAPFPGVGSSALYAASLYQLSLTLGEFAREVNVSMSLRWLGSAAAGPGYPFGFESC